MPFSVLMSLYYFEKPEYIVECFESLLCQTVTADEWIIVEDGPLTKEIYELLDEYQKKYPGLINRYRIEEHCGLGPALRLGVNACKNELIARMDTDDIARRDRFEKQIAEFRNNPQLDICGCHIIEFDKTIENVLSKRKVPLEHDSIVRYQRRRSAFNHMTVMFRKSTVLLAGNYQYCPYMEDDFLWVRMIKSGAKCKNIDDYLVWARTGMTMIKRRSGWKYYKCYRDGKRKIKEIGFINCFDYYLTVFTQFLFIFLPDKTKLWAYRYLLR